ncbi:MAG: abhydrolase domain-containing protein 6 [Flavobacteriales bacterium]|jgi:abhydrolase domain-containing protein 6
MNIYLNLPILAALLLLSSCNVAKMRVRHTTKAMEKSSAQAYTFVDADGSHHVWASNNGKPKLMLIHGITGSSVAQWSGNAQRLGEHYDLIIPDLIGHGKSIQTWSGSSIDAQVEHLNLLLDSLHITESIHLVGNSYGGAIAANFAEQHPNRVKTLVINAGPASDFTHAMADSIAKANGGTNIQEIISPTDKKGQRNALKTVLYKMPILPGFVLRQFNDVYIKPYHNAHMDLMNDLLAHEEEYSTKVYDWPMPVYLLWGQNDQLIPLEIGIGIQTRNDLAADHLIIIPKCGHIANVERAEQFEREIKRILVD